MSKAFNTDGLTSQIREDRLFLYRRAGRRSNYRVRVIARAGQTFKGLVSEDPVTHEKGSDRLVDIPVSDGYVGIAISNKTGSSSN